MSRYIDAEKLLKKLPADLPYKASVKRVLMQAPTADVVPKSEVDMSQWLLKDAYKRIEELDELCGELQKSKAEVAREIFMDIDRVVEKYSMGDIEHPAFVYIIAELKKKYTQVKQ